MKEFKQTSNEIRITGLGVRTTNKELEKIGKLWNDFLSGNTARLIKNIVNPEKIFVVYTDYESDHTGEYLCIIGFEVNGLDNEDNTFVKHTIKGGEYLVFNENGNAMEIVPEIWQEIWTKKINRTYKSDFEVYDLTTLNSGNTEVSIYIGVE